MKIVVLNIMQNVDFLYLKMVLELLAVQLELVGVMEMIKVLVQIILIFQVYLQLNLAGRPPVEDEVSQVNQLNLFLLKHLLLLFIIAIYLKQKLVFLLLYLFLLVLLIKEQNILIVKVKVNLKILLLLIGLDQVVMQLVVQLAILLVEELLIK